MGIAGSTFVDPETPIVQPQMQNQNRAGFRFDEQNEDFNYVEAKWSEFNSLLRTEVKQAELSHMIENMRKIQGHIMAIYQSQLMQQPDPIFFEHTLVFLIRVFEELKSIIIGAWANNVPIKMNWVLSDANARYESYARRKGIKETKFVTDITSKMGILIDMRDMKNFGVKLGDLINPAVFKSYERDYKEASEYYRDYQTYKHDNLLQLCERRLRKAQEETSRSNEYNRYNGYQPFYIRS